MQESSLEVYNRHSAAAKNMASCHVCNLVSDNSNERCPRCNTKLHLRVPFSLQDTLAYLILSIILYIPANIYPIMTTSVFGNAEDSTIIGGVVTFFQTGSYFVASVIFIASVIIPMAKMGVIAWLCYSVHKIEDLKHQELTSLYRLTEFIGKWSMIDVFVVAVLVALIQIEGIMTIQSGIAANAFAGVVIATMVAAQKFDTRLIWDKMESL